MSHDGAVTRRVLDIDGVSLSFGSLKVLSDVSLAVDRGESVAIIGPSGAGKTSLLNCIVGITRPQGGRIIVDGKDVVKASRRELADIRSSSLGVVFQSGELLGELTAIENVVLPALIRDAGRGDAEGRAQLLLRSLGVPLDRKTVDTMSGGERQRTALARALMNKPALILADEPTGALDAMTRDQVAEVFYAIPESENCGLLVVTHDAEIARRANRVVRLGS